MSLSTTTQIAQWAQSNAASHEECFVLERNEQTPVLLTPAIALAAVQGGLGAGMVGVRAANAATAFGYDSGELSSPKAALDTGHSINSTLEKHPYSF